MRTGLRPYITVGIALVGTTAVAITPIAAIPRDVKVPNPDVELGASPFDAYVQAIEQAFANAQRVIGQALADPAVFPLIPSRSSTACSVTRGTISRSLSTTSSS